MINDKVWSRIHVLRRLWNYGGINILLLVNYNEPLCVASFSICEKNSATMGFTPQQPQHLPPPLQAATPPPRHCPPPPFPSPGLGPFSYCTCSPSVAWASPNRSKARQKHWGPVSTIGKLPSSSINKGVLSPLTQLSKPTWTSLGRNPRSPRCQMSLLVMYINVFVLTWTMYVLKL